jgi:hypothetical protein
MSTIARILAAMLRWWREPNNLERIDAAMDAKLAAKRKISSAATITLIDRDGGGIDVRLATSNDEGQSTRIARNLMLLIERAGKGEI